MSLRNLIRLVPLAAAAALTFFAGVSAGASSATNWTVIVGGQTPDVSVYANGFYPRELTIHTGDTITWQFAGFHNVSFLSGVAPPQFAIKDGNNYYANPQAFFPAGVSTYDGTGFRNSGVPQGDKPFSYSLTFTKPGRYEYACTLHPGMTGVVNVVDGGVTETPEAVLARGRAEQAASLAAGTKAYESLSPQVTGSRVTVPLVGDRQARFSLLRFTHDPLVIAAGTTVTWTIQDPFEVHTVTFAGAGKLPEFFIPQAQAGAPPKLLINAVALTPTSTTTYDGTGFVNSGLLGLPGAPGNSPSSFSLTFTKPGRYVYWCLVHDHENQQGVVIVK
ncbi:MAG TPA: plastocyanin/azurin family copper-binding protein [Candidatus Acidoferrales bacterium]|nr:plastocyanin/azurin family copper-binding protein [Candidatus Acidoferrales bacterium]